LETPSSWVLEFEGKARANPNLSDASFLGKLLELRANVILGWKVVEGYKPSSSFGLVFCNGVKKGFVTLTPGVHVIKLFSFVADKAQ
jgi:hypothetical protein